jgi:hypothetical protein
MFSKLVSFLCGIGAAIIGVVVLFFRGKSQGRMEQRQEDLEKKIEQIDEAKKQNDEIDSLSTDDIRERMHDEFSGH